MMEESRMAWKERNHAPAPPAGKGGACGEAAMPFATCFAPATGVCSDAGSATVSGNGTSSSLSMVFLLTPEPFPVVEAGPVAATPGNGLQVAAAPRGVPGTLGFPAEQSPAEAVCQRLWQRNKGAFISGGPRCRKSTLLRVLHDCPIQRLPLAGHVSVVAPTGTSTKTARGTTYHWVFGFVRDYDPVLPDPVQECGRLLSTARFIRIKERLGRVRALLLDEVSLVGADKRDVMYELLRQSRLPATPACLWLAFGDFL